MLEPAGRPEPLDPGLTGSADRPVPGIDNGFVAGYRVRFDEAGPDGLIRTSALLRYAQDVAWRHSEDLGFDRAWYTQRGRWWVVRSVDLSVLAPIAMGRTLRVSTAVIGHRRIWARRLSECRLADGTLAASVTTDWVILDDRGRLVRIPDDFRAVVLEPPAAWRHLPCRSTGRDWRRGARCRGLGQVDHRPELLHLAQPRGRGDLPVVRHRLEAIGVAGPRRLESRPGLIGRLELVADLGQSSVGQLERLAP